MNNVLDEDLLGKSPDLIEHILNLVSSEVRTSSLGQVTSLCLRHHPPVDHLLEFSIGGNKPTLLANFKDNAVGLVGMSQRTTLHLLKDSKSLRAVCLFVDIQQPPHLIPVGLFDLFSIGSGLSKVTTPVDFDAVDKLLGVLLDPPILDLVSLNDGVGRSIKLRDGSIPPRSEAGICWGN